MAREIISAGQRKEFDQLQELVSQCDTKLVSFEFGADGVRALAQLTIDSCSLQLVKTAVERVGRADMTILWNFLLGGFKSNSEAAATKRFAVTMAVLNQINQTEVTSKQCFELITRLFIELPKLSSAQLIELSQYCVESLRTGDPKCTG